MIKNYILKILFVILLLLPISCGGGGSSSSSTSTSTASSKGKAAGQAAATAIGVSASGISSSSSSALTKPVVEAINGLLRSVTDNGTAIVFNNEPVAGFSGATMTGTINYTSSVDSGTGVRTLTFTGGSVTTTLPTTSGSVIVDGTTYNYTIGGSQVMSQTGTASLSSTSMLSADMTVSLVSQSLTILGDIIATFSSMSLTVRNTYSNGAWGTPTISGSATYTITDTNETGSCSFTSTGSCS